MSAVPSYDDVQNQSGTTGRPGGLSRRRALQVAGAAGATALLAPRVPGLLGTAEAKDEAPQDGPRIPRFAQAFEYPPVLTPVDVNGADVYTIEQRVASKQILPKPYPPTEIYGYNGSYPGPTIRQVRNGRRTIIRMKNSLPVPTSTHLHGSPSQPDYDGHPEDLTKPGAEKYYQYPNDQESRILWYHDHALHETARNVYKGLVGFFLQHADSSNPMEAAAVALENQFPHPYDVPMMIGDMQFTQSGKVFFDDGGEDSLFGNVQLVNGVPWPTLTVERRKYRFRFLVATLSRGYQFRMSNGMPMYVIGTDAGLLPAPVKVTSFRQGMAERYDVVIDFSDLADGTKVRLLNSRADEEMRDVMQFVVKGTTPVPDAQDPPLPTKLNTLPTVASLESQVVQTRRFRFERSGGEWVINGVPWESGRIDAMPRENTVEKWILENSSGGWFHPIHIHLVDFLVSRRNGRSVPAYEAGLKDTAYVGEGETVEVLIKFIPPTVIDPTKPRYGRYVMHCHNLVHEDHDMMNQFCIQDTTATSSCLPPGGTASPTPSPSASPTASASASPTASPSSSPAPSVAPSPTASATASVAVAAAAAGTAKHPARSMHMDWLLTT